MDEYRKITEQQNASLTAEVASMKEQYKVGALSLIGGLYCVLPRYLLGASSKIRRKYQRSWYCSKGKRRTWPQFCFEGLSIFHYCIYFLLIIFTLSIQLTEAEQRVAEAVSMEAEACKLKDIAQSEFKVCQCSKIFAAKLIPWFANPSQFWF